MSTKRFESLITVILALGIVLLAPGCKVLDAIDSVNTMDDQLDQTNKSIAETQATAARTDARLEKATDHQRQGDPLIVRSRALELLEKVDSIEAKLDFAGTYVMAMEFQLYDNFGSDTPEKLLDLKLQAFQELFKVIHEYADPVHNDRKIGPDSTKNSMETLYAIASVLHKVNPNVEKVWAAQGLPAPSLFSMMQEALLNKPQIESLMPDDPTFPEYQKEVLRNEEDAKYLLQLRANFLPAIALARISRINDFGGLHKFWTKLSMYAGVIPFKDWTAQLEYRNNVGLGEDIKILKEGLKARDLLRKVGFEDKEIYDGKLLRIFNNMKLDFTRMPGLENSTAAQVADTMAVRKQLLGDWMRLIDNLRQGGRSLDLE